MQIKGDKQLAELTESVQHMSDKFDEFKKDRKGKEEIINNLKEEVSTLKGRVETLEKESNDQEQYLRRNCILVHGLEENKDKITDDLVASFIKDKMDIDRSYQIGKPNPRKIRPIIVKFVRYNDQRKVFSNKKKLKDSRISITESLTARRMGELSKACNKHGFKNMWTIDGKILFKENGSNKAKLWLSGINVTLSYGEKRTFYVYCVFLLRKGEGFFWYYLGLTVCLISFKFFEISSQRLCTFNFHQNKNIFTK